MRTCLVSKNGCVYLHDMDTNEDVISLSATEAMWLSHFVQNNLLSELVIQLRLASYHANATLLEVGERSQKIFQLKKG